MPQPRAAGDHVSGTFFSHSGERIGFNDLALFN
jgi:hypothetical protein